MSEFYRLKAPVAVALAAMLSNTSFVAPTLALELFGHCIVGTCADQVQSDAINFIDPKRYTLDFAIEIDDEDLGASVKNASNLWQGGDDAVGGSAGLLTRAKGDYRRILAGLYNAGYYGGSISIKIDGIEAASISAGTSFGDNTSIRVVVDAGAPYVFGQADVVGAAPATTDKTDQVPSFEKVGFAPGLPAKAGSVGKASKLARDGWREQGYAKARIVERSATANHPNDELNVSLKVEPGARATYGKVSVEGTQRMDPEFVVYQTGLKRGEEYDPDDLERARKRLERLGVFSSQKLEEAEEIQADGSLPLMLTVDERKLRRIGAGATISSIEGVGLETYWLHRNLFGRAERLRLDASVSGLGSTFDYQKFDYALGAAFTKPGVFTPDTDLNFNLFGKREVNELFTETSAGGSVSLTHLYSDSLTFEVGAFAEYGLFEDAIETDEYITAGLDVSAVLDTRDSKIDPKKGFYVRGALKPFHEFEYANFGLRAEAEARTYLALGDGDRAVLAARLNLGSIIGPAIEETPDNLLFFAGGGGSVRGYGFKNIGVVAPDGTVSGGRSKIELSTEARFKMTERFGGVIFADAGNVSPASIPDFSQDIKIGVGAGVRYYTGLGPIRLDVAVPLNRRDGDPQIGFYAGIGQAF